MPRVATKRVRADLVQDEGVSLALVAPNDDTAPLLTDAERETAFLMFGVRTEPADHSLTPAERQAAFLMFGIRAEQPAQEEWAEPSWPPTAEAFFRALAAPTDAANDAAQRPQFPALTRRGVHVEPGLAIRFIQALDWVVVFAIADFAARWGMGVGLMSLGIGDALAFVATASGLKAGLWLTEVYRTTPAAIRPERAIGGLALGAIMGLLLANFLAPDARGAGALAAILPPAAMLLAGIHYALATWIRALHAKGVFSETVVLVGATDAARRLAQRVNETGDARVVAIAETRLGRAPTQMANAPVCGDLDQLLAWEGLPHVDRIVITVSPRADARVRELIQRLRGAPNRVDLLLDFDTETVRGRRVERFGAMGVACVSGRPRNAARQFVKRAQDLVVGGFLALALALPMLAIAAAVRFDSKGPALYRQRRHGFNNRTITILKFRSMRHDPGAPILPATKDDPRVTRVGRFLRRTSLDELPQLWNVLIGEMSLVGPRPHAIDARAAERELTDIVSDYAHRHRAKPGITGWAQVNGARGTMYTAAQVRERVRLDLDYVQRASLWLDLKILAQTAIIVARDVHAALRKRP